MATQNDRTIPRKKGFLSKSQMNLYLECPRKWKYCYIDQLPQSSSPQQERGKSIHFKIETFYKNNMLVQGTQKDNKIPFILPKDIKDIEKFFEFEQKRIKECTDKDGNFCEKYFKPVFQELYLEDDELKIRGVIDAVYINPTDDSIIVIDWKTGKYHPEKFDDYIFELAVYAYLLRKSGKVENEIKKWGIYFVDADKLFIEDIDEKYIKNMLIVVEDIKKRLEAKDYKKNIFNPYCKYCDFRKRCKHDNS